MCFDTFNNRGRIWSWWLGVGTLGRAVENSSREISNEGKGVGLGGR